MALQISWDKYCIKVCNKEILRPAAKNKVIYAILCIKNIASKIFQKIKAILPLIYNDRNNNVRF